MNSQAAVNVTALLKAWSDGDSEAADQLIALVYDELRRQASRYLSRERGDHTLRPTALVNEAYLRLVRQRRVVWQDRGQFFAVAATVMRRLLVDYARQHGASKRGGAFHTVSLDDGDEVSIAAAPDVDVIALNDALVELSAIDPQRARMIRASFLRRTDDRRNRGSARRVDGDGDARMASGARVAAPAPHTRLMTPERWSRADGVVRSGARPRARRTRGLPRGSPVHDDDAMQREVSPLIESHERAGDFGTSPVFHFRTTSTSSTDPDATEPGSAKGCASAATRSSALVGSGGMGEVYRARDPQLGRDVGVKVLPHGAGISGDQLARFGREARALAALNHPNILTVYDVGLDRGHPVRRVGAARGRNASRAPQRGPLSVGETMRWRGRSRPAWRRRTTKASFTAISSLTICSSPETAS